MKLITAIIKPLQFESVSAALETLGVAGITASEVRGLSREQRNPETVRGDHATGFKTKIKLEVAVTEAQLEQAIELITSAAQTGSAGDGSVFVTPLDQAIRIHTGAALEQAH